MPRNSALSPTQFESPGDLTDRSWPRARPTQSEFSTQLPLTDKPSLLRRTSRAVARFLIAACIGVAATLAWQSYGEIATQIIASWAAQHGWLPAWLSHVIPTSPSSGPEAAAERANPPAVQTSASSGPQTAQPAAVPAAPSSDQRSFEAMTLSLAEVRQRVEQLAVTQEEMANEIVKLHAAEQDIRRKMAVAPPASKPNPTTPTPSRDPTPVR